MVAGFFVASAVMMLFEYINSFFFPLPADLDWTDAAAVHAFTLSLPWTAYILVILGWALGSFKGGCVTTYVAHEKQFRVTAVLAAILVIAGIGNVLMIGHPPLFTALGIAVLAVCPYLGHRYLLHSLAKKSV